MSARRLNPHEVEHYVAALDAYISQGMRERLLSLTELMDDDGFIRLDRALNCAVSPGAKDKMRAFRQFRQRLRKASIMAQIGFHLPVDDQWSKSAPHTRYCWFVVEEFTDQFALSVPSNNKPKEHRPPVAPPTVRPDPGYGNNPTVDGHPPHIDLTAAEHPAPAEATGNRWAQPVPNSGRAAAQPTGHGAGHQAAVNRPAHGTAAPHPPTRQAHSPGDPHQQPPSRPAHQAQATPPRDGVATGPVPGGASDLLNPAAAAPDLNRHSQRTGGQPWHTGSVSPVVDQNPPGQVTPGGETPSQRLTPPSASSAGATAHPTSPSVGSHMTHHVVSQPAAQPVSQAAAHGPAPRQSLRVYVATAVSPDAHEARYIDMFVTSLTDELDHVPEVSAQVRSSWHLQLGLESVAERHRLCQFADAVVVLVSAQMLTENHLEWEAIRTAGHVVVPVTAVPHAMLTSRFAEGVVLSGDRAFSESNAAGRSELLTELVTHLVPAATTLSSDESAPVVAQPRHDAVSASQPCESSAGGTHSALPAGDQRHRAQPTDNQQGRQRLVHAPGWQRHPVGPAPAMPPAGPMASATSHYEAGNQQPSTPAAPTGQPRSSHRRDADSAESGGDDSADPAPAAKDCHPGDCATGRAAEDVMATDLATADVPEAELTTAVSSPGGTNAAEAWSRPDRASYPVQPMVDSVDTQLVLRWAQRQGSGISGAAERNAGAVCDVVIDALASPTDRLPAPAGRPPVDRLIAWSNSHVPRCLLTGSVAGLASRVVGAFVAEMLARREAAPGVSLPVYIDVSGVSDADLPQDFTGLDVLQVALNHQQAPTDGVTVDAVASLVTNTATVLILDGVTEFLANCAASRRSSAMQAILGMLTRLYHRAGDTGRQRSRLLVITSTAVVGEYVVPEPTGLTAGQDFLVCAVVPTEEHTVQALLHSAFGDRSVDLWENLAHALRLAEPADRQDLAHAVGQLLIVLEQATLVGRTCRPVDLMAALVSAWLRRDQNPHGMKAAHKELMLEYLAAELAASGDSLWRCEEPTTWLAAAVGEPVPDSYAERALARWREDLQAAAFVMCQGSADYGFSSSGVAAYFLATRLVRATLTQSVEHCQRVWDVPALTEAVLDFTGQAMAQLSMADQQVARETLQMCASRNHLSGGNVFRYGVHAAIHGYPHHDLRRSQLAGVDLEGMTAHAPVGQSAQLAEVDLSGASLRQLSWVGIDCTAVNFTKADLTGATFDSCVLDGATMQDAVLHGVVLRGCVTAGLVTTGAASHRAQALHCSDAGMFDETWLTAPSDAAMPEDAVLQRFTGHADAVTSLAMHPRGELVASVALDNMVCLWDVLSGEQVAALPVPGGSWHAASWSPRGHQLAGADAAGHVMVWDMASGGVQHLLPQQESAVTALAWSPDGQLLATGTEDGTLRVWRLDSISIVAQVSVPSGALLAFDWDAAGVGLVAGSANGVVTCWDTMTWSIVASAQVGVGNADVVFWDGPGSRAIAAGDDGMLRAIQLATGAVTPVGTAGDGRVVHVGHDQHGALLALYAMAGTVGWWHLEQQQALSSWTTGHASVTAAAVTNNNYVVVAATGADQLTVWHDTCETSVGQMASRASAAMAVSWSSDGSQVMSQTINGDCYTLSVADGESRHTPLAVVQPARSVAWSHDESMLACADADGPVRVWDADTGRCLHVLEAHSGPVRTVSWQRGGALLATGGDDGKAVAWDVATGEPVITIAGLQGAVQAVAWSPDGSALAVAVATGAVLTWDADSWHVTHRHLVHLPGGDAIVLDSASGAVVTASEGAWRWLGWSTRVGQMPTRLPAETGGPLPAFGSGQ